MDEIELAKLFAEYAETRRHLETLEVIIRDEVERRAESVKIAGVEAKYYKPSFATPDYQYHAQSYLEAHPEQEPLLAEFSTQSVTTRWKELCEALGVVAPPGEPKPARVVIK